MPGVDELNAGLAAGLERIPGIEARLAKAYARIFRRFARSAVANLQRHAPLVAAAEPAWRMPDPDELIPLDQLQLDLHDATDPVRQAAVVAIVEPAVERFDIAFDVRNPLVDKVLHQLGNKITAISEDARQDVMAELHVSWESGESIPQAATRIRGVLGGQAAGRRGEVIARTEIHAAVNGGSLAAAQITGAGSHKQWLATMDKRTRKTHAAASGQVVGINEPFDVGSAPLRYPGDPEGPPDEVVQCRCVMLFTEGQLELPGGMTMDGNSMAAAGGRVVPAGIVPTIPGTLPSQRARWSNVTHEPVVAAAAVAAPADPLAEDGMGAQWEAVLCICDTPTGDGRQLASTGYAHRDLPLSLMGMTTTPGPWGGHEGAEVCGRIDSIDLTGENVIGGGRLGTGQFAADIERMIGTGELSGVSVDLAIFAVEWAVIAEDGSVNYDPTPEEEEQAWWNDQLLMIATEWQIMGATVCPFPAFEDAKIGLVAAGGASLRMLFSESGRARVWAPIRLVNPLTASAAGLTPAEPPAEWFAVPEPDAVTPFTVSDDGQVYGHLAAWQDCHIAYADGCVSPPRSPSGYAYFHTGELVCAGGERVTVGRVTIATGHPALNLSREATLRHYDDTGTVAAYVRVVDGEHGPWMCGAIEPDLDASRLRELRASAPSGDWRPVNRSLELVGVLGVNVQGFPRPRSRVAIAASGAKEVTALVAAGAIRTPAQRPAAKSVRLAAARMIGRDRLSAELARRATR